MYHNPKALDVLPVESSNVQGETRHGEEQIAQEDDLVVVVFAGSQDTLYSLHFLRWRSEGKSRLFLDFVSFNGNGGKIALLVSPRCTA